MKSLLISQFLVLLLVWSVEAYGISFVTHHKKSSIAYLTMSSDELGKLPKSGLVVYKDRSGRIWRGKVLHAGDWFHRKMVKVGQVELVEPSGG